MSRPLTSNSQHSKPFTANPNQDLITISANYPPQKVWHRCLWTTRSFDALDERQAFPTKPASKMPRKINWTAITPVMATSDAEMLLESLKAFKVTKSHLVSCGLCNHAAPHAMRVRLLVCNCQMCYAVMPCLWRGKTLACQHLNLMKVEEAGTHVSPAPSPTRVRLTSAMKEVAREWAAQGLKPSRIRSGFLRRFNLDEASLPPLSQVQRFVHNYAASHLHNNDFLKSLRTKIREVAFTGDEDENQPFTFTPENDPSGRPNVGNGSDDSPFIVGVTSKTLLHRLDRDPASFIFHLDATYKLSQAAYPVLVIGISDKARSFHPVAVVVMSQQKQFHHAKALGAVRYVYQRVVGKPLLVHFVMADADKGQRNAVEEVFAEDCSLVHLMCYFHVAKNVYEKAKGLEPSLFAMVLRDLHNLHFTADRNEYETMKSQILAEWASWPGLAAFSSYFRATWLSGHFWRWQAFHTPSGYATTNNPVEQYNAALKRDVTVHRKLKMGLLLERFIDWCYLQSTQATGFASTVAVDARLQRRARELEKKQLLTEVDSKRHSIAFLLGDTPANTTSPDVVYVRALPASRPYDENQRRKHEDLPASAQLGLHTARMETEGMPASGWRVNVRALTCPCRFHMKFGTCTHVLFALNARGHIDLSGRERLVYRGPNKKRKISSGRQGPGRPTSNGHALHIN